MRERAERLENLLPNISRNYYLEHSFTGSGNAGDIEGVYQKSISPYIATVEIITKENATRTALERLKYRLILIEQEFSNERIKQLEKDVKTQEITQLMLDFCEYWQEVDFYVAHHLKRDTEEEIDPTDNVDAEELARLEEKVFSLL